MKKIYYSFLGLLAMFFITSGTLESPGSERLFEKIIFVELSPEEDSVLFMPYSKAWEQGWDVYCDISVDGSDIMNAEKYSSSFDYPAKNLYTILHPMIINGSIQSYCPYDPESFGLGQSDEGELRFPIGEKGESFLSSETMQEELCYLLGRFGPMSDVPLTDEYGDYLTITEPDGTQYYKYPPRNYEWHTDQDIIKYKLRVSILFNKKGKEKKRIIKAICPVVNRYTENDVVNGETELLWFNFEELEPTLEEAHYFDKKMKPVSYLDYFQEKVKNASLNWE